MRFDADSTFAPKPFKASSLKEAVVQRKTEREREKEGINWCGRNNSRLGDCWARTEEMSIPCVCVDLFVYNIYVCVWVWHACVSFFSCVRNITFWKIQIEYGLPPVSENGMWSGLMLHFDWSSLACDLCHPLTHTVKAKWFEAPFWTG